MTAKAGIFRVVLPDREIKFHLIPNELYYFDVADVDNRFLMLNTVS